ncbi:MULTISPECIES: lysozyme inhibitor LprI family protein [Roseobacteraceae]|uniref:Putative urease-associated protein n=1 Tax=Celeribacter baekdonensis B30 TaxID=1208323 RepID=K2JDU5_9RHOB|nr:MULTISPECIES: lysozyme inhibitor LprI family protein [Roseobacteraceae]EKE73273.1 putative urease-associated protein [Celeribacter baekdonensis B30]
MIRKALILIAFCGPALAEEPQVDCDNAMTQTDMNICSYQDYQAADVELNETYAWAMDRAKGYGQTAADALRTAQRAWIPYRDAACEAEAVLYEGGSIQPLIMSSCLASLTRQRTDEMRSAYQTY